MITAIFALTTLVAIYLLARWLAAAPGTPFAGGPVDHTFNGSNRVYQRWE